MTSRLLAVLVTVHQAVATALLLVVTFGFPVILAGIVAILPPSTAPPPEAAAWMGTSDRPTVVIAADAIPTLPSAHEDASPTDGTTAQRTEGAPGGEGADDRTANAAEGARGEGPGVEPTPETPDTLATERPADRRPSSGGGGTGDGDEGDGTSGLTAREIADRRMAARRAEVAKTAPRHMDNPRCKADIPGIEHLYGDRYRVEGRVLERYGDVRSASSLAAVRWSRDGGGNIDGFVLERVPCDSPLTAVGLQPGDVIRRINGRTITSLPDAFAAVRKLRRHDALRVDFSRRGRARRLVVTVD